MAVRLTAKQSHLSQSSKKRLTISGLAFSGKTQVLVQRALNAMRRTGSDVLLTYFQLGQ